MTPVAASGIQYRVPPEPKRWPSIALAAAVHAGLLAFLYIGVSWQNTAPVAVEAEVWDMKTQAAAPPPPPPPVAIEPEPQVAEPPPQVEQPAAPTPPDIALEREKRKEEKKRKLEEKKAEELKAKQLADKKALEAEKKLEEKKAADKLKADKLAKAKQAADEQKKLDKVRAEEMRRITAGAGAAGEAPQATAPRLDTGYIASITSKIKSATSYLGSTDVPGNPKAEFKIEQLPTGEIISVKLMKSSGIAAFDDAVEKGIIKASPLPKKKNGSVERTLVIAFEMKDMK
jgi:colicin import membrane protein